MVPLSAELCARCVSVHLGEHNATANVKTEKVWILRKPVFGIFDGTRGWAPQRCRGRFGRMATLRVEHRGFRGDTAPIWLSELGVSLVYGTPYEMTAEIARVRGMALLLNLVRANKVWVSASYSPPEF